MRLYLLSFILLCLPVIVKSQVVVDPALLHYMRQRYPEMVMDSTLNLESGIVESINSWTGVTKRIMWASGEISSIDYQ